MAPVLDLFITLLAMGENGYLGLLNKRKRLVPVLKAGLQSLCDKHRLSILSSRKNSISIGVSIEDLRFVESTDGIDRKEADLVASIDQVAIDTVDAPVPTPTPTPTPTPAPISFASSKVEGIEGASTPTPTPTPASSPSSLTFLGAMLFQRCVSGCRVVVSNPDPARAANTIIANHTFKNWGSHLDYYPYSYFTVACSIGTTEKEVESFLRKADKTIMEFKKNQSKKPL